MLNHLGARFYVTHFDYMRFIAVIIGYILDCFTATICICSALSHHIYSSLATDSARSNIPARRAAIYIARDIVNAWMYAFSERIRIFCVDGLLWLSTGVVGRFSVMRSWRPLTSFTQNIRHISHAGWQQRKWAFGAFSSIGTPASASHRLRVLLEHVKQSVLPSTHTLLRVFFHLGGSGSGTVKPEGRGLLLGFQALFFRYGPSFWDWSRARILCVFSRVRLPSFSLCCRPQLHFGILRSELQFFGRIKNLVPTVSSAATLCGSFTGGLLTPQVSLRRRVLIAGEKPCVAVATAFSVFLEVRARRDETHCDGPLVESRYRYRFRLVLTLFVGWMALRNVNHCIKNPHFDVFSPLDTLMVPQVVFFVAKIFLRGADWTCIRRRPFFRDPVDAFVHNIKEYCSYMESMIGVGLGARIASAKTSFFDSLLGATQAETPGPEWDGHNVISTMREGTKTPEYATKGLAKSSVKNNTASKVKTVRRYRKKQAAPCKPISKDEVCKCAVCKKRIDDVMDSIIGGLCGAPV